MKRFFDKIEKTSSCWNWTAALRGNGYGCMKYNGKLVDSHRVSWMIHNGDIPKGLLVCHSCDNRKCVNPDHLFLGTQSENMQDCLIKGRLKTPIGLRFVNGSYPKNTKIPLSFAISIKKAVSERGCSTLKSISIKYGVPYQYVRDISCGRILKNY